MAQTANNQPYDLTIRYQSNVRSGRFQITVEYESPEDAGGGGHGLEHRGRLTALLERAGVLRGDCLIRIVRAGAEELFRVRRSPEAGWTWELLAQREAEREGPDEGRARPERAPRERTSREPA